MQKWSQTGSPKNKSKEESQFAKPFWRGKMIFWAVSSQVMKRGSTKTTLKRSDKVHNGRLPIPPRPKIFCRSKSRVKIMLVTFFDIREIVHYEFVPTRQSTKFTVWKYWKGCVKKTETTRTFCQHFTDLASRQCTCSHGTVRKFLATKQIIVLEHPAYSPDLAPTDFLRGRNFDEIDDIRILQRQL